MNNGPLPLFCASAGVYRINNQVDHICQSRQARSNGFTQGNWLKTKVGSKMTIPAKRSATFAAIQPPTKKPAKGVPTKTVPAEGLKVWNDLLAANRLYAKSGELPPEASISVSRRESLLKDQKPKVCVICCSDSRAPPELIFRAGLGELFIVRTAGTSVHDVSVLGSIEFAIANLGCSLVILLGHLNCGAVKAAVSVLDDHTGTVLGSLGKNLQGLVRDEIGYVVAKVRERGEGGSEGEEGSEMVKACTRERVRELLEKSKVVRQAYMSSNIMLVPAFYDFKTGLVSEVSYEG